MSNEIITQEQNGGAAPAHMFERSGLPTAHMNTGAVAIEQERAIAEAQGQLILAKRFPRSTAAATAEFLESCKSIEFAESAFYTVPNRGHGPSIRFAEEAARCYGNFQYGHRELSRSEGKSEVEVYAWDMERNNYSKRQITVMHILDLRDNKTKILKDQTDIDNRIANVASKQIRGRILALMPKAMIEAGKAMAKKTLAGGNDKPLAQRITDLTQAFMQFGVTADLLARHLKHSLDAMTIEELADLRGIYTALREGASAAEFFSNSDEKVAARDSAITEITNAATGTKATDQGKGASDKKAKPESTKAPPTTEPPATEPPATEPPAKDPPATSPPATDPPATEATKAATEKKEDLF